MHPGLLFARCQPLPHGFVEQHAARDGRIQAFHRAGIGNRHPRVRPARSRHRAVRRPHCLPAGHWARADRLRRRHPAPRPRISARPERAERQTHRPRSRASTGRRKADPEDARKRLGIPQAHSAGKQDHPGGAEGFRRTHQGAQISRVLQPGCDHHQGDAVGTSLAR